MCGLSLYISHEDRREALRASLDAIAHRGPDAQGYGIWDQSDGSSTGLGHVRLSIVDTSDAGNQPMISHDGRVAMIFNGEIYNHHQLRKELNIQAFKSASDSEVLLECYAQMGVFCFSRLRGIFAAAFLELDTGRLRIVRDQIGVKPIYYTQNADGFYASSEVRGLEPFLSEPFCVSPSGLFEFLTCGFVHEPETGLLGVHKVPPGCYLEVVGRSVEVRRFFTLEVETRSARFSERLLNDAVHSQLEADVKLGVFFSGGIDSSVIASLASREALCAVYDENEVATGGQVSDEPYADQIASLIDIELTKVRIADASDPDAIFQSMAEVARGTEELISDYTYFASLELSKAARARGYKVMLSGTGGDEAFVGYPRYKLVLGRWYYPLVAMLLRSPHIYRLASRFSDFAKKLDRFKQFFTNEAFSIRYARTLGYFTRGEVEALIGRNNFEEEERTFINRCAQMLEGFESDADLVKALVLDYYGYLSHNLTVADKSSMSEGLELRVPLLDPDLYCGALGSLRSTKRPRFGKRALRAYLLKILPRRLVDRRKSAFNPPLDSKITSLGEDRIIAQLSSSTIASYIDFGIAELVVRRHFAGLENNSYKIWQLIYLSFWLEGKAIRA